MKKLLNILSTLTISGTVLPTVIAVSPYEKQEIQIENIQSNDLKIDSTEISNRIKRSSNNSPTQANNRGGSRSRLTTQNSENINSDNSHSTQRRTSQMPMGRVVHERGHNLQIRESDRITSRNNNRNTSNSNQVTKKNLNNRNYLKNINSFLSENPPSPGKRISIKDNQKIFRVYGVNPRTGNRIYVINQNPSRKILEIPLKNHAGQEITAILNPNNNLYMDGFITNDAHGKKTYWHFKKDHDDDDVITKIEGTESKSLGYNGNYNTIRKDSNLTISKSSINQSIADLAKFNGNNPENIKNDLVRTIFMTSEAMRFFSVRDEIDKVLNSDSHEVKWSDHENTLTNWNKYSKKFYERIKTGRGAETQEEHNKIFNVAVLAPNK